MKRFLVIGLGAFGAVLARRLHERGAEVLAIDSDPRAVEELKDAVSRAVIADATDRDALLALGADKYSTAVVAIGENREANILVSALLRELGIPILVARATGPLHARILEAIGVSEVVSPEADLGRRLADTLCSDFSMDRFPLAEGVDLGEVPVTPYMVGKSLRDLDLRKRFHVNVVSVQKRGRARATGATRMAPLEVSSLPDPDARLEDGDVLILIGATEALDAMMREFGD